MKKYVITGTSGLIGSHLAASLAQQSEVYAISRHNISTSAPEGQLIQLPMDLTRPWSESDLPERSDAVIHLAQSEHFREFPEAVEDVFHVNTHSTLRLLDYARRSGAGTFILASSGGVYGFGEKPFSEDAAISYNGELGFYLKTKLCSELLVETYSPFMNIIVLRFFFVYGPGQRKSMLIPRLVQSVMDGKPIGLQGADGLRINPTHVSDAVRAIEQALTLSSSQTINIGGPEVLSLRDIGNTIGRVLGKEPLFEVDSAARPKDLIADIQKMSDLLAAPQINFEQGVADYIKHTYPLPV